MFYKALHLIKQLRSAPVNHQIAKPTIRHVQNVQSIWFKKRSTSFRMPRETNPLHFARVINQHLLNLNENYESSSIRRQYTVQTQISEQSFENWSLWTNPSSFLGISTSALVTIWAPASLAALPIAKDTDPIPPSTYLQRNISDIKKRPKLG